MLQKSGNTQDFWLMITETVCKGSMDSATVMTLLYDFAARLPTVVVLYNATINSSSYSWVIWMRILLTSTKKRCRIICYNCLIK